MNMHLGLGPSPLNVRSTGYGGYVSGEFRNINATVKIILGGVDTGFELDAMLTVQDFAGADICEMDFDVVGIEITERRTPHYVVTNPHEIAVLTRGIDREFIARRLKEMKDEP